MQILLDNFIEAWINAIKYHDKIMKGYITLGIQKQFVSSLHNAVELCLKQKMLDKNDTFVAEIRIIKDKKDAELSVKYFQKAEKGLLNEFFEELSKDEISKFRSIEFNQFKTKYKKLIDINETEKELFTESLDLLPKLRNNETHFYIDNSFLSEEDFCKLHNFMIVFYKSAVEDFLEKNKLIHQWRVWGSDKIKMIDESGRNVIFNQIKLESFSYKQAILDNELSNIIKERAEKIDLQVPCDRLDAYASYMSDPFSSFKVSNYSYEDIHTMLLSMKNIKLVEVKEYKHEEQDYNNNIYVYTFIYLNFNF